MRPLSVQRWVNFHYSFREKKYLVCKSKAQIFVLFQMFSFEPSNCPTWGGFKSNIWTFNLHPRTNFHDFEKPYIFHNHPFYLSNFLFVVFYGEQKSTKATLVGQLHSAYTRINLHLFKFKFLNPSNSPSSLWFYALL